MKEPKIIQCPHCDGWGKIPIGDHFVTRQMAIDAGMPETEGQFCETEYCNCGHCGGDGLIEEAFEEEDR